MKESSQILNTELFPKGTWIMQLRNYYLTFVMRCAIWHHLYNLRNVKNTHGRVLLLVKVNCTNGTKSRKASHLIMEYSQQFRKNLLY